MKSENGFQTPELSSLGWCSGGSWPRRVPRLLAPPRPWPRCATSWGRVSFNPLRLRVACGVPAAAPAPELLALGVAGGVPAPAAAPAPNLLVLPPPEDVL